MLNLRDILSVSLILFSVIDILSSVPVILDLRKKYGHVQSEKATLISGVIMIVFLFVGESILKLFGLDVESFAIAGAIVIFLIGLEMVLGITIFRSEPTESNASAIVPLAFPLIAGAGTMTTILSLRAEFNLANVLVGVVINLAFVYLVLKTSSWLERKIGQAGFMVMRKVFGIVLLAIAIKLFKSNLGF